MDRISFLGIKAYWFPIAKFESSYFLSSERGIRKSSLLYVVKRFDIAAVRVLTLSLFIIIVNAVSLHANEKVKVHLMQYIGDWTGEFTIHSVATGYTERVTVNQSYTWKDEVLKGQGVSIRANGELEYSESICFFLEGQLYSEVTSQDKTATYIGVLHEGSIVWLESNLKRAKDYQLTESFETVDGEQYLVTEGFDSFDFKGKVAYIVIKGRLQRAVSNPEAG